MKKLITTVTLILSMAAPAFAIPELQLYIEGASWDSGTETWMTDSNSFKLWVIGDTGAKGNIDNVKLSVAYDHGQTGTISLTGTTTSLKTDPSTAANPTFIQTVTDGSSPILGDGSALPSHGIYGTGTDWMEFSLGNFTLKDSPIADVQVAFPLAQDWSANNAQINVYDVLVTGFESGIHFDAYDHYYNNKGAKYVKAPFSHDAEGGGTPVPEPGTFVLVGAGLAGLALYRRRQSK